ncbi:MAG: threonine synthase, partial [Chloroflexota bacterium]
MGFARSLRCRECGTEYPLDARYVCAECFGPLEVTYNLEALQATLTRDRIEGGPRSLWRYRDLLPVSDNPTVDLQAGFTPLLKAENLGRKLGLKNLYIKNDAVNPTYSFKDRPVAVAATKAVEFGFDTLACASTGNLAASVAAHAAKAGLNCFVFIPADLEAGKIVNTAVYGATLVPVRGSYDQVNRLCTELADRHGWAFVNINLRPYYAEGSKTLGFEVAEQLGWRAPDACVVPVASGALFTKVAKGLAELAAVGLIEPRTIRMYAAQAAGSGPVADAYA